MHVVAPLQHILLPTAMYTDATLTCSIAVCHDFQGMQGALQVNAALQPQLPLVSQQ